MNTRSDATNPSTTDGYWTYPYTYTIYSYTLKLNDFADLWSIEAEKDGIYITYGIIFCLCILVGTPGNLVSFFYFKSKKKSLSTTIYMLISANDIVVSMAAIPLAMTDLSQSQNLIKSMFGDTQYYVKENSNKCAVWFFVWETAIKFSVFLTTCLSYSRTISLIDPFRRQRVKNLLVAILIFLMLQLTETILYYVVVDIKSSFDFLGWKRCILMVGSLEVYDGTKALIVKISRAIFFVTPAFAVAISCVASIAVLVQARSKTDKKHKVLEISRNRATITILLFALLYGVCNIPLVIGTIISFLSGMKYLELFDFDTHFYYRNASTYLLLAVNSAANPIFYFWRMPALRESVKAGISSRAFKGKSPKLAKRHTDISRCASGGLELRSISKV